MNRKQAQPLEESYNIRHEELTPHETTELHESMNRVSQLMAALPEKQRQVMHLRDVEGYSYNEICDILALDMNQVKVNLFRARNAVREKLMQLNAYGL
jgi:RNA polymerase sigma-70 factor (ECF subfamily)